MDQLGCNLFLRIFALGSIEINVGKWSIKAAVEVAQEADALNLPFLLPTLITIIAIIAIIAILTTVANAIIVTNITNITTANIVTTVAAANVTNVTRRR